MAVATGYSLTGPTAPSAGATSATYTVTLTPAGGTSAADTITPATATGNGTFTPATVSLSTATPSLTFTFTPADPIGTAVSISTTNSLALTNPGAIAATIQPPQGGMQTLTGDCYAPTRGATLALTPGTTYRLLLTVTSLPTQMTAASLTIKATAGTGTALITKAGLLADVGTLTTAGTSYTGKVVFLLATTDDAATILAPGTSYEFGISVTCAGPETYEPAVNCILQSLSGGTAG